MESAYLDLMDDAERFATYHGLSKQEVVADLDPSYRDGGVDIHCVLRSTAIQETWERDYRLGAMEDIDPRDIYEEWVSELEEEFEGELI